MTTKFKHNTYCDCFECASPDAPFIGGTAIDNLLGQNTGDWMLDINNALGFGVKSGDWIETTKVINIYDGAGNGKVLVPPTRLQVDHLTPKFVYVSGLVTANGLTNTYKGWYIYRTDNYEDQTYVVIPKAITKGLNTADQGVQAVKDFGISISDKLGDLFGSLKWIIVGVLVLLIVLLVLKFS